MYARTMAMLRGCEVWVCVSWWVRVRESGAARAWGVGRRWADGDYACKGLRTKWRRCGAAPAVKWVKVRGGWARKMRRCGVRVGCERSDAQLGLGRKWARRLGSRGGLFARGALFASSRLIDRYKDDDAARHNHEEGVERQLGIDQNKYGQKEPKRDNKADLYVAEVPRRAWGLWHNGLGWAERLDNRKEPKRDNKADLYVAEVSRRTWSLWHNGLGRA